MDDAKLDKMLEMRAKCGWNASEEGKAKRDKARADMGKWIADVRSPPGTCRPPPRGPRRAPRCWFRPGC